MKTQKTKRPMLGMEIAEAENALFENVRDEKNNDYFCFVSDFDSTHKTHKKIIENHYHEYIELIYVLSGELLVTVNKNHYTIYAGSLLVIVPGEVHSFERKKGCKYACIQFAANYILSGIFTKSEFHFILPYMLSSFPDARCFDAAIIDNTLIPNAIHEIIREDMDKKNFYRLSIRAKLSEIALWIFREWSARDIDVRQASSKNNSNLLRLAPVLDKMNTDYNTDLDIEKMAKLVNMSYSYFSRLFKATVGRSFSEHLNFIRITEAEQLLLDTEMSVADIALAVGFTNSSYFIAQFRNQYHVTPKQYRSKYAIKEN